MLQIVLTLALAVWPSQLYLSLSVAQAGLFKKTVQDSVGLWASSHTASHSV